MQEAFNSHPRTVGDFLSGNERSRIVVPEFQRGYSWTRDHVDTFWSDIKAFQTQSRRKDGPLKYFLGPVVTLAVDKSTTLLLDGQQRLATATILLASIREAARAIRARNPTFQDAEDFRRDLQRDLIEKESVGGFALAMGEIDLPYFRDTIQSDPPKPATVKTRTHQNISEARKILDSAVAAHIDGLSPSAALSELRELRQLIRSDLVMACIPVVDERDAFKIFETLNNRGLRLSPSDLLFNYLMSNSTPAHRLLIRESWTAMVEEMGTRDVLAFLRHLWVCRVGDIKNEDLYSSIQRHIEAGGFNCVGFAEDCQIESEVYGDLLDADPEKLEDAATFVGTLVNSLGCKAALPLLLAVYNNFPGSLESVAKWTLIHFVKFRVFMRQENAKLESLLFGLAHRVYTHCSENDFKAGHLAIIKKALKDASPDDAAIKGVFPSVELTAETSRYVVRKIADYMQSKTGEVAAPVKKTNIEHIFPKRPSEEGWRNADVMRPLLWNIGNLTLLGTRLNRTVENGSYEKKRHCFASTSELRMANAVAEQYKEWNPDSVKARAASLADDANAIWNFDNPSRV